jgi:hypothetical protein
MSISTLELIESLENESIAADCVSSRVSIANERERTLQIAANTLRQFRDTLISIANCQHGGERMQAQDVLIETGECAHFNSVYGYHKGRGKSSKWVCRDCGRETDERLGPFE